MGKKISISDLNSSDLENKVVFLRVDLNVPIQDGNITDTTRIDSSIPTITYLIEHGAKVVIGSHLGRPKGKIQDKLRLAPIGKKLSELLDLPVKLSNDSVGDSVKETINTLKKGDILLLENLRFYNEETANDPLFSQSLANLADIYVNDSFGTAHRAHASTEGIAHHLPSYLGLLFEKEINALNTVLETPKRPLIAIIGGAKVSSKISVLENLLDKVDTLIIGGGMTYTFLKAQGYAIGKSLCENEYIEKAQVILNLAKEKNISLILPEDHVVVSEFNENAAMDIVDTNAIPDDKIAVDIGPKTIHTIQHILESAGTILWNGPLGVFEMAPFSKGTFAIAESLAHNKGITIVGGGDSVAAIKQSGHSDAVTHISTGGGASLEFLEGKTLPGLAILRDK